MNTQDVVKEKLSEGPVQLKSVLKNRFSPRIFDGNPMPEEDVKGIMEAGRWAPSSSNRQPWYFYWAPRGTPGFNTIVSFLDEGNQEWAPQASVLMIGAAILEDERGKNHYARYDLGQAVQSMVVEAYARGYYVRQMGGFDKNMAAEKLPLGEHQRPVVAIAMGNIGNYETAPQKLQAKESESRTRKEDFSRKI